MVDDDGEHIDKTQSKKGNRVENLQREYSHLS